MKNGISQFKDIKYEFKCYFCTKTIELSADQISDNIITVNPFVMIDELASQLAGLLNFENVKISKEDVLISFNKMLKIRELCL